MDDTNVTEKPDDAPDDQMVRQMTDIHLYTNNDMQNIHNIKRKIQNDIEKNEILLDLHCEELSRDIYGNKLIKNAADSFDIATENRAIGSNFDHSKLKSLPSNGINNEVKSDKPCNKLPNSPNSPPNGQPITLNSDQIKARSPSSLPRFNINSSGRMTQRIPIDPQKKSKLLAHLKSIEAANANL